MFLDDSIEVLEEKVEYQVRCISKNRPSSRNVAVTRKTPPATRSRAPRQPKVASPSVNKIESSNVCFHIAY